MIREMHDATKGRAAVDAACETGKSKNNNEAQTAAMDRASWDLNQEALRAAHSVSAASHTTAFSTIGFDVGSCDVGVVSVWRRKSLELLAMQYNGKWTGDGTAILDFTGTSGNWDGVNLAINTKSGASLVVAAGDWVVKKPDGQISIIPPDVFAEDYCRIAGDDCGEQQDAEQKHMDSLIAELADLDIRINKLTTLIDHVDVGAYHMSVLNTQLRGMKTQRVALAARIDEVSDHGEGVGHGI